MKLKVLAASVLLAMGAGSALADDQTVAFDSNGVASFIGTSTLLAGGSDVLSFSGLLDGVYNYTLSLSGQGIDLSSVVLSTQTGAVISGVVGTILEPGFATFAFASTSGSENVWVTLLGSTTGASAAYSGELVATPVPEPQTYALLLAGLGAVGFMARRRRS